MKIAITFLAVLLAACTPQAEAPAAPDPAPVEAATVDPNAVQVMVLGVWHFDNPGRDVVNTVSTDVLEPKRQEELEAVATALATFKPTVVAVERQGAAPDYADAVWPTFTDADLATKRDERVQLGYRIAKLAGVRAVVAIDEQPSDGEPDYFPFDKVGAAAEAQGKGAELGAMIASVQEMATAFEEKQATSTLADLLAEANEGKMSAGDLYYATFRFDQGENQPGAELQAYWFMRNAKIFSKLAQNTKPGDRVLIVYGAGHKFWLDHFARETPGFVAVDPVPFLRNATQ